MLLFPIRIAVTVTLGLQMPSDALGRRETDLHSYSFTCVAQVEENLEQFDASRSTGQLCATTAETFKQVFLKALSPS